MSWLVNRLRFAAPQWRRHLKHAIQRARRRFAHARVAGVDWYWPDDGRRTRLAATASVRLLAPFDPLVWDRRRFEQLWGWSYRFEAYAPQPKRKLGYYALPLLWGDRVIGWGNLAVKDGRLESTFGYVDGVPRDPEFGRLLEEELERIRRFLRLTT
jgi:hypothetical protein